MTSSKPPNGVGDANAAARPRALPGGGRRGVVDGRAVAAVPAGGAPLPPSPGNSSPGADPPPVHVVVPIDDQPRQSGDGAPPPPPDVEWGMPKTHHWRLIGRAYDCPPHLPPALSESAPLSWNSAPFLYGLRHYTVMAIVAFVALVAAIVCITRTASVDEDLSAAYGVVLAVLAVALGGASWVLRWNATVRHSVARARGKARQARTLWPLCPEPWTAKDVWWWEHVGWGLSLYVLRDGTTEVVKRYGAGPGNGGIGTPVMRGGVGLGSTGPGAPSAGAVAV